MKIKEVFILPTYDSAKENLPTCICIKHVNLLEILDVYANHQHVYWCTPFAQNVNI